MTRLLSVAKYAAILFASISFGIFTVNQFTFIYFANTDPVTFHDMIIDPNVISPGDPLHVTAVLTRHRFCWSERREWVADVATNSNKWERTFANASTDLGFVRITNDYYIPAVGPDGKPTLKPGEEYVLRMMAHYRCNFGDQHTIRGPEVRFRVEG